MRPNAWDLLQGPYIKWCESQSLTIQSADEMLYRDDLTGYQRDWLVAFVALWEVTERAAQ